MEKIVLKDGTEINVSDVTNYSFSAKMEVQEMVDTFAKLTQKSLSRFELQTQNGDTMAVFVNKAPTSCKYEDGIAEFTLRDVNELEVRVTALEEAMDSLLMEDMIDIDSMDLEIE